jgi:hypothetical protein
MYYPLKIKPTKNDDIDAALNLVIELAFQNVVDRLDNPGEYRRQMAAVKLVRDTFTKAGELR